MLTSPSKKAHLPGAERAFNGPVEVAPRRPRQENARIAASFHLGRGVLAEGGLRSTNRSAKPPDILLAKECAAGSVTLAEAKALR